MSERSKGNAVDSLNTLFIMASFFGWRELFLTNSRSLLFYLIFNQSQFSFSSNSLQKKESDLHHVLDVYLPWECKYHSQHVMWIWVALRVRLLLHVTTLIHSQSLTFGSVVEGNAHCCFSGSINLNYQFHIHLNLELGSDRSQEKYEKCSTGWKNEASWDALCFIKGNQISQ